MQKILGIDLGASSVKAVAIEASFRSHVLRGYRAERVLPFEPPAEGETPKTYADRALPALEALARDGWFEADQIVCGVPGAWVAAHSITLPFTERKQIDATLAGEVETLIPFDPTEVVFDSHIVAKAPGKTELLVGVIQNIHVQAVLDLLRSVKVDPAIVTFSALSLANLFTENYVDATAPAEGATGPVVEALVDIGAERTNILILENGEPRFARTASAAGNDVTQALARAMEVPKESAEEAKRSVDMTGAGGEPTLTVVAERAVSGLIRELRSTFSSYATRTRQKVTRVRLVGGGSHLTGLAGFLSNAFAIPVEPLTFRAGIAFPEPAATAQGALALALALRGLGGSRTPRLNFRRGTFAYAQAVGELRSLYIGFAAMAAVLVVLFGVNVWARLHALEAREAVLDATLCDATKKIYGKCDTDYKVALGTLKGKGSPASAIPQVSAVGLTVKVSQLFPASGDTVLSELEISDGQVRLRGEAKNYDAIDDLVTSLQADKCFSDVKRGKLTQTAAGRVEFALDGNYTCGGLTKGGS